MTTPLNLRVERDLAELRDEISRRPPALVTLDTLDRLATAVEDLARAVAGRAAPEPESIAYTVAWIAKDGEIVLDKAPTTLAIARAELADYRARWPEMTHYLVALVPVEVAP